MATTSSCSSTETQVHSHYDVSEEETIYSDNGYLASPLTPKQQQSSKHKPASSTKVRSVSGFSKLSDISQHTLTDPVHCEEEEEDRAAETSSLVTTTDTLSPIAGSLLRKCARKYSQSTPFEPVLKEPVLESMSLSQLRARVEILNAITQDLNVNLVESLMRRDELRAEQDAKMTDLEDIQSLATVMSKETTV